MLGLTKPSPMSSTPPPAGSTGTTTAGSTAPSEWSRPPNTSKPTTLPSTRRSSPHENGTKAVTLHRSLPRQATPATAYQTRPKATPAADRTRDHHNRVRQDRVDDTGVVTLRINGKLHHIGIGRTHARTHVLLLVHDLQVRIVDAATGQLYRELLIDPNRDYQPTGKPPGPTPQPK